MYPNCEYVMIIDDNSIDLYVTSRIIKSTGFGSHVLAYASADEALTYLKQHADQKDLLPQIIIVDIYMPVMSGFEFMEEYEKLPVALKDACKVFIVSSTIDEDDISRANHDKNVLAFQEKPLTKQFLQSICL